MGGNDRHSKRCGTARPATPGVRPATPGARTARSLVAVSLVGVSLAAILSACSAGGGGEIAASAPSAPPPLTTPLVDATTGRALGTEARGALDRLASGASAGTLLARSTDDRVCVFANGRNGWNRAAC